MDREETDPQAVQNAYLRIRREKELCRAELMMELALEKFAELEGMRAVRRRLLVHAQAAKWY